MKQFYTKNKTLVWVGIGAFVLWYAYSQGWIGANSPGQTSFAPDSPYSPAGKDENGMSYVQEQK